MSAPHADRDHSEQPPSTATAGSDPTQGTSRSLSARESDEEVVDRIVDGARQLALVSGVSMREALDTIRVTADLADAARERERAESAEAERDEIAGRLSALLCELTGGRLSKTTYDVPTMVAEIDSAYDDAQREERAERDRLADVVARVEAIRDDLRRPPLRAPFLVLANQIDRALSGPTPAETPQNGPEPALSREQGTSGQSGEGEALRGAEKGEEAGR